MFDGIFYRNTVQRPPLYFPAVISFAMHVAALLLLMIHPELVFAIKLFHSDKQAVPAMPVVKYDVVMTFDPLYLPPTRVPITSILSDRDRTAASEPENLKSPNDKTPFSNGESSIAIKVGKGKNIPVDEEGDAEIRRQKEAAASRIAKEKAADNTGKEKSPDRDTNNSKKSQEIAKLNPPQKITKMNPLADPALPNPKVTDTRPEMAGKGTGPAASKETSDGDGAPLVLLDSKFARKNPDSSFLSPGGSIIDAQGFQPGDDYVRLITQRLRNNLMGVGDFKPLKYRHLMILSFHIERDGRISNLRFVTRSGDDRFDLMALNSVYRSNPFPPLPKGFPKEYALVEYTPLPPKD
ncbi:MAG: TonB C-terminal domain-containing protein [Acidobacteria bacterium]|nr:TonB C-terminal domain-containing protein [Acidobacteriota bacterium]